jgi:hypothetical protein
LWRAPNVLERSVVSETKDALGAVEYHKVNAIESAGQYSGIGLEWHFVVL